MTEAGGRARRVGEQLQRELAGLIQRELNDPRVQWVTVSAVKVARDFAHAKVYVTVLNESERLAPALAALEHAAGFLRHELGRRMRMRVIPQLHFVYDESVERGTRLSKLIDDAVALGPNSGAKSADGDNEVEG